jgi:hypothetical protein
VWHQCESLAAVVIGVYFFMFFVIFVSLMVEEEEPH